MPTRRHLVSFCLGAGVVIMLTLLAILPTTKPFAFMRLLSPFHVFASDEPLTLESVFAADKPWTLDLPWDVSTPGISVGSFTSVVLSKRIRQSTT